MAFISYGKQFLDSSDISKLKNYLTLIFLLKVQKLKNLKANLKKN